MKFKCKNTAICRKFDNFDACVDSAYVGKCTQGLVVITEEEYDVLYDESFIYAAETGADRESGYNHDNLFENFLSYRLGVNWTIHDEEF